MDIVQLQSESIHAKYSFAHVFVLGCSQLIFKFKFNFKKLKAISFVMNGKAYNLSPYDYTFVFNALCYSGFSYSSSSLWILGDVFLGAYYSVYDKANVQLGLAVALGSSSSITNSTFSCASRILRCLKHVVLCCCIFSVLIFLIFT